MFNLFKKNKNIDTSKVNSFNDALKTIKQFIYLQDFIKAEKAINEIIKKENSYFDIYIGQIEEKNKKTEIKKFKKNIKKLEELKKYNEKLKKKYEDKKYNIIKINEFKKAKENIKNLIGKKEYGEAINLTNILIEKFPKDLDIINFSQKTKKEIQKRLIEFNKKERKNIKEDTLSEIKRLIGDIEINIEKKELEELEKKEKNIFNILKIKLIQYKNLKNKKKEKKILDEIELLLKANDNSKKDLIKARLENIHSGYKKDFKNIKIIGYEFYGITLSADKISGDSIGFEEGKKNYGFYIGDAKGHGIKAGLIISKLTNIFKEIFQKKSLEELTLIINNSLKQELDSGNFITSIFFDIKKENKELSIIGMGHLPIYIFRKKENKIEKIIPGGLRAGIRIIKDTNFLKSKNINLENEDILFSYTDGIIETKNMSGELFGFEKLEKLFLKICQKYDDLQKIQQKILEELEIYNSGKNFSDDITMLFLKRDITKDIISEEKIEEIINKENLNIKYKKMLKNKNINEIENEVKKIKKEETLKNIIRSLDTLYKNGELLKLKQDCIRYIKEGFIDKKINFYLKKAIENENIFKIKQKEKKLEDKYRVLLQLYKSGEYETVINECSNIIQKEGNI